MPRSALLGIAVALLTLLLQLGELSALPVTYDQRQQGRVNVQVDVKDMQIVAIVGSDMLDDFNYDYAYDYADFTVKPNAKPTTTKVPDATTTKATPVEISSSVSPFEWLSSSAALGFPTSKAPEEPLIQDTKAPENHLSSSSSSVAVDSTTVPTEIKLIENATKTDRDSSSTTKTDQDSSSTTKTDQDSSSTTKTDQDSSSTTKSVELTAESTSASTTETSSKRPLGTAEPRKRCPAGFQMRSGRCFKRRQSLISPRLALMKLAPQLLAKSQLFAGLSQATMTI